MLCQGWEKAGQTGLGWGSLGGAGIPRLRCPGHPWVAAGTLGAALVSSLAHRESPQCPHGSLDWCPPPEGFSSAWPGISDPPLSPAVVT